MIYSRLTKTSNQTTAIICGLLRWRTKGEFEFMSEKHPECPLYNPLNCKEYYNPKLCAFVRKDKVCLKKKKPKTKPKKKVESKA